MKIDWDKDSGKWNIRDLETDVVLHRVSSIRINTPSELVSTDGMRHGYLVVAGRVVIKDEDDTAFILKG